MMTLPVILGIIVILNITRLMAGIIYMYIHEVGNDWLKTTYSEMIGNLNSII